MRFAVVACVLCACADGPLQPPTGERVKYVLSALATPESNTEARQLGLDLNGDETIDNQLGMVIATLTSKGANPSFDSRRLIDRGELLTLAQLQYARPSDQDDSIALTFFAGTNPSPSPCIDDADTTCGRHLQGDGQFVAQEPDPAMLGERTPAPMFVGPQTITTSISFYGEVLTVELAHARVRLNGADDVHLAGTIAGGLRRSETETKLAPALMRYVEGVVARGCSARDTPPVCGCIPSQTQWVALDWLQLFDTTPKDCVVTVQEILGNSLVVSLINPDLTIDDEQLLSVGIGFEAVPASF